jgi:hypothetical protein
MTIRDFREIPEHNAERDERGSLNDVKGDRAFPGDGDWRWFVFSYSVMDVLGVTA